MRNSKRLSQQEIAEVWNNPEARRERKEVARRTRESYRQQEHISRKFVALDKSTTFVNTRYRDGKMKLTDLRFELEELKKALEVQQQGRDDLVAKIKADKEKAAQLADAISTSERAFADVVTTLKEGKRLAMLGGETAVGLKQTTQGLQRMQLEHDRGYSCAPGTTPGPGAATRLQSTGLRRASLNKSMPTLAR